MGKKCAHKFWCPQRPEAHQISGCWDLNLDSLQEQDMLFATKPSLQPEFWFRFSSDFVFSLLPKTAPCTSHSRARWDVVAKGHKVINK